jgi:DNA-binding NtrC family response regulator
LWIAGPGWFRRRLLAGADDLAAARALLTDGTARELWHRPPAGARDDPEALAADGRWRAAAAAWERRLAAGGGAGAPEARLGLARALYAQAAFERTLETVAGLRGAAAGLLRARCQLHLGRLGAARRTVDALARAEPEPAEAVELAAVGARLAANRAERGGPRRWAARALAAGKRGGAEVMARAELVAALAAWDRGARAEAERRLAACRDLAGDPDDGWRWLQAQALTALAGGDPETAAESLGRALGAGRRRLYRHRAAGLWNDLGLARAQAGDLAGSERAFRHALRLYRGCDGPRQITLAAVNLAEIELRRGRLSGVRDILERSTAANRADGNLRGGAYDAALWARYELVHGRPGAALDLCREALGQLERAKLAGDGDELRLLAARALGWLDRPEAARAELEGLPEEVFAVLEPEERPAVEALAGDRERALARAAGTPLAALWSALLTGAEPPAEAWDALAVLEPYRAARTVYDCDRLEPGSVPARWLRRAVATLRRIGAGLPAERLEARDAGPWRALAEYLGRTPGEPGALAVLFAGAGYPEARLTWRAAAGGDERVFAGGPGGGERLAAPAAAGEIELSAPELDPVLSALFRLALRDLPAPAGEPAAEPSPAGGGIVGRDPALLAALERADRLAPGGLPVLIHGESGTGKELMARRVHRRSVRREGPFVAINCAALSESLLLADLFGHVRGAFTGADRDRAGVFESARGGTVFLDEIGDLPPTAQGMLLRVLQEGEVRRVGESLPRRVDVRVVTASHRDLEAMVREGSFRQDLYYRLRGAVVVLPPLRERGADVLLLAEHLLAHQSTGRPPAKLSPAAQARLLAHAWPGNVRELDNTLGVAAALAAGGTIEPEHLELPAAEPAPAGDYHRQVEAYRRRLVEEALTAAGGNGAEAARHLGLTRQALSYLVRKLGLL